MSNGEYLGFLKKDNSEKREVSESELEVLRSRIEAGENLSDAELGKCSTDLLALYLQMRGIKYV